LQADEVTLRQEMVTALREEGLITTDRVAEAMTAVPRLAFAPGEPLEKVYEGTIVALGIRYAGLGYLVAATA
jgi:protein-L-isoaspartate O-methyltransferase